MAILNLILLPVIAIYLIMYLIFKYGEQFYKQPTTLGIRQWDRLARWKFREFNELPHLFNDRMEKSVEYANDYINQFPSYLLDSICKFISFVLSSIVVLLILMGLFNSAIFNKDILWVQYTLFCFVIIHMLLFR